MTLNIAKSVALLLNLIEDNGLCKKKERNICHAWASEVHTYFMLAELGDSQCLCKHVKTDLHIQNYELKRALED